GLVDGAPPPLGQLEGEADVLAAAGVELDVRLPSDCVDAAVPRRDPGEPGLHRANRHLIAPIEALLIAALASVETDLPADVAHLPVGEAPEEATQGIGSPMAVRVREGEDLARRPLHRLIERSHLPSAGELEDEVRAGRAGQLGGAVRGAVGCDHDFEAIAGI